MTQALKDQNLKKVCECFLLANITNERLENEQKFWRTILFLMFL